MIKFYKSLLFFTAMLLILAGIFYYKQPLSNTQSWGALIAIIAFFYGGAALLVHLVLWVFLKNKPKILLLLEFAVIAVAALLITLNKT